MKVFATGGNLSSARNPGRRKGAKVVSFLTLSTGLMKKGREAKGMGWDGEGTGGQANKAERIR